MDLAVDRYFDRTESSVSGAELLRREVRLTGCEDSELVRCLVDEAQDALCAFIRVSASGAEHVRCVLEGRFEIQVQADLGWVLKPSGDESAAAYWLPAAPKLRKLDGHSRILNERDAAIRSFGFSASSIWLELEAPLPGWILDLVIWRLDGGVSSWLNELDGTALEREPGFVYGSHTVIRGAQNLYRHLVFGNIYEDVFAWPRKWKIPDELDAYGLYLRLSGLEAATGKRLYRILKQQVVHAVVSRQRLEGGWFHGEWTDDMECHVRLHCGGMHLLATAYEEDPDPAVLEALAKAAGFLASLVDQTEMGAWILHDTLELSREGMEQAPFAWLPSTVLGKKKTNMLVLNTHLDSLIALDRYRALAGDQRYDDLISSGQQAAKAILSRRPAEFLYKWLYRLIDLTLLPSNVAKRLPLPLRALKRLTWKYLIPRMHYVRTRWPRLVMPNGFIDRAISLRGVSHVYQSVNIMDLVRYRQRFPDQDVSRIIDQALAYTQNTQLRAFWAQDKKKSHALGFWADALWHLCVSDPEPRYRRWLAEAMLYCEDAGIGMPPVLLGANTEGIPFRERVPCPSPKDGRLRVANLGRSGRSEIILVNPVDEDIPLRLEGELQGELIWSLSRDASTGVEGSVPARGWAWGRAGQKTGPDR